MWDVVDTMRNSEGNYVLREGYSSSPCLGKMKAQKGVYDSDRILSIDSFKNALRDARSALGKRAIIASRVVFFVTVIRS